MADVRALSLLLALTILAGSARAEEVIVAVASNFAEPAAALGRAFEADGRHEATLVFGATGALYAQIVAGAPFGVFLAADEARPRRLADKGLADAPRVYAIGRVVLWGRSPPTPLAETGAEILRGGDFRALAIANPDLAPYGRAALDALAALGLEAAARPKLVYAANARQAHAMAATGAADLAFVPLAALVGRDADYWTPDDAGAPIRQAAVLLRDAPGPNAARDFFDFLFSDAARATIASSGYDAPG
ncbi:MAG: molybdate ABC transporter substrate-binding protein [Parvularculaceae bacterium]